MVLFIFQSYLGNGLLNFSLGNVLRSFLSSFKLPLDFNLVYLWGCESLFRQTFRILRYKLILYHLLEHELRDRYNAKLKIV